MRELGVIGSVAEIRRYKKGERRRYKIRGREEDI